MEQGTLLSIICLKWEGSLGGEWIHAYDCPFAGHLKLTTLLIGYTPIQNKKFDETKKMKKSQSLVDQDILLSKKYKLLNRMGNVILLVFLKTVAFCTLYF